ncbi:hypothetical protein L1987_87909 [Smallanthus sonchifolius]|nr:hypothetical protein L1987_87909 [Smallanthus sonchifolius]
MFITRGVSVTLTPLSASSPPSVLFLVVHRFYWDILHCLACSRHMESWLLSIFFAADKVVNGDGNLMFTGDGAKLVPDAFQLAKD